jgi:hypothetical protein
LAGFPRSLNSVKRSEEMSLTAKGGTIALSLDSWLMCVCVCVCALLLYYVIVSTLISRFFYFLISFTRFLFCFFLSFPATKNGPYPERKTKKETIKNRNQVGEEDQKTKQ